MSKDCWFLKKDSEDNYQPDDSCRIKRNIEQKNPKGDKKLKRLDYTKEDLRRMKIDWKRVDRSRIEWKKIVELAKATIKLKSY